MARQSKQDQPRIAAVHEAGHVVMRHHHGLATAAVEVYQDGTGMTWAPTGIVSDVRAHADVCVSGAVAEDLFLQQAGPSIDEIEGALLPLELGDEVANLS